MHDGISDPFAPVAEETTPRRAEITVLVSGSMDFPYTTVVPEALLRWWNAMDKPDVRLVIDHTPAAGAAFAAWDHEKYPVTQVGRDPLLDPHAADRAQWRRMTATVPAQAFLFQTYEDQAVISKLLALTVLDVPTRVITIEDL